MSSRLRRSGRTLTPSNTPRGCSGRARHVAADRAAPCATRALRCPSPESDGPCTAFTSRSGSALRGVVHGDLFPLLRSDTGNRLKLFQIWLNLPARIKMVEPHFVTHWADPILVASRARASVQHRRPPQPKLARPTAPPPPPPKEVQGTGWHRGSGPAAAAASARAAPPARGHPPAPDARLCQISTS